jgi:hypothetical protein
MSGDPADNGVPPDRQLVERALRVAQYHLANPTASSEPDEAYWRGAREALRWSLGRRGTAPVSQLAAQVDLDGPRRATVDQEARYTYECMRGERRTPEEFGMRYLTGAENTLYWIARGHGFVTSLAAEVVREEYGID